MKHIVLHTLAGAAMVLSPAAAESQTRRDRAPAPVEILAAANDAARQRPRSEGFDAARQIYTYYPGAIFELYANPNYVSAILLEPGETLASIAAGDTARWMVTQAEAETEAQARTLVLVKPHAPGLRTNIVLLTDRRTYLIEAISQSGGAYAAQIAWSYPQSDETLFTSPLDAINLDYGVRTIRGRAPVWAPVRVFDDGRRTFIVFAAEAALADLPPLFVITGEGAELVNYRVRHGADGPLYEVDRLFDAAELRLGVRAPIIVRIERAQAPSPRRHRGRR